MQWTLPAAMAAGLATLAAGGARCGTISLAGPASARPGGTVTISVELPPDLNGVYALQGGIAYDPAALTPLPTQTDAPQGYHTGALPPFPGETIPLDADLFRMNLSTPGRLLFGYVKNPSNPPGTPSAAVPATALKITFEVTPAAKGTTEVSWTPYAVNGRDLPALLAGTADGTPLDATPGAALPIVITLKGDADGNGAVEMDDVQRILEAASGLETGNPAPVMENADVWPPDVPDGRLTLEDAHAVARMVSGLDPSQEG